MENNGKYLSQEVLDTLCVRVAQKLPCLENMHVYTMWYRPERFCLTIENNVLAVNSVILEVLKEQARYGRSESNPYNYEVMFVRIYIMLYYRHADDELYQTLVFPELIKHMGIYAKEYLPSIQDNINKLLELDKLIEQKKNKNVKPKYSLLKVSAGEADRYFSEFSQEELFRRLCSHLESIQDDLFSGYDVAEIWLTAKDVVKELWQESKPDLIIDRVLKKLASSGHYGKAEEGAAEVVIACVYAMMRTVTKSDHFQNAIEYIEYIANHISGYEHLRNEMNFVKEQTKDLESVDDYDFTVDTQDEEAIYTQSDVASILQNQSTSSMKFHIAKGRATDVIKTLYALCECGVFEKEDGTKADIKDVMESFGDMLDSQTVKNYSSSLSGAKKNSKSAFLQIITDLENALKKYYREK